MEPCLCTCCSNAKLHVFIKFIVNFWDIVNVRGINKNTYSQLVVRSKRPKNTRLLIEDDKGNTLNISN